MTVTPFLVINKIDTIPTSIYSIKKRIQSKYTSKAIHKCQSPSLTQPLSIHNVATHAKSNSMHHKIFHIFHSKSKNTHACCSLNNSYNLIIGKDETKNANTYSLSRNDSNSPHYKTANNKKVQIKSKAQLIESTTDVNCPYSSIKIDHIKKHRIFVPLVYKNMESKLNTTMRLKGLSHMTYVFNLE